MSLSSRGHMDPYQGDPDLDHYDMTPEQRQRYQIAFDVAMPKLDSNKGTVMVFGTGGDMDEGDPEWVAMYHSRPATTEQMKEEVDRIVKYFTPAMPIWWEETDRKPLTINNMEPNIFVSIVKVEGRSANWSTAKAFLDQMEGGLYSREISRALQHALPVMRVREDSLMLGIRATITPTGEVDPPLAYMVEKAVEECREFMYKMGELD